MAVGLQLDDCSQMIAIGRFSQETMISIRESAESSCESPPGTPRWWDTAKEMVRHRGFRYSASIHSGTHVAKHAEIKHTNRPRIWLKNFEQKVRTSKRVKSRKNRKIRSVHKKRPNWSRVKFKLCVWLRFLAKFPSSHFLVATQKNLASRFRVVP